ncbi:MAG: hypothetical protein ACYCQI_05755 [Gammaproteobacteria bacterium]
MNLRSIVASFPSIHPGERYENEEGMNPAYQTVEEIRCPLKLNEKRIWALRSDMLLATGVKNAEVSEGNTPMAAVVVGSESINPKNRYGHPSLAVVEKPSGEYKGYDGKVYYAGWIAQRTKHLEVFVYTGRCLNSFLSNFEKRCLELYIAIEFMKAYGEQDFLFVDRMQGAGAMFRFFLPNKPFDKDHLATARTYSSALLKQVMQLDRMGLLSKEKIEALLNLKYKEIFSSAAAESMSEKKENSPKGNCSIL